MDEDSPLTTARAELAARIPALAELVAGLADVETIAPGSEFTAREVAVHLIVAGRRYAEIATGTPSPLRFTGPDEYTALCRGLIADIPETDPARLAALVTDSLSRVVEVTEHRPGAIRVVFHNGQELSLTTLLEILLDELTEQGQELAAGQGRPAPPTSDVPSRTGATRCRP